MDFIQINVALREENGSAAVRRLRRSGKVPANLYGLKRRNLSLSIGEEDLQRFLRSESHLIELKMGDEARPAIVREIQIHPVTDEVLHVDFTRVDADTEVEDSVRIHFKGRAKGTAEGGVFNALMDSVILRALPKHLPHEVLVEVAELELGDGITVAELQVAANVTVVSNPEEMVCNVSTPKAVEEEEPAEGELAEGEAPAEGEEPAEGGEAGAEGGGES